jgi:hypothetical protein
MSDNLIVFPKEKLSRPPQSMSEIIDMVSENRISHIAEILDDVMTAVVCISSDHGYYLVGEDCIKDLTLVSEALRSTMYKCVGIDHPLQAIAENHVDVPNFELKE